VRLSGLGRVGIYAPVLPTPPPNRAPSSLHLWIMPATVQAQLPKQRRANNIYAKREAAKRGANVVPKSEKTKPSISPFWIGVSIALIDLKIG
ncbi:hypothetical protein NEOLI_001151, partial [Neolecta irregularis DAH-3]